MANVLEILIKASEKAANIARSCCDQPTAETLLVTEKSESEANSRFDKDFKTIADVLAQEAAKSVIISHFPELSNYIRGEESSEIGGVTIKWQDDQEETYELLQTLLPKTTAQRMATAAHTDIKCSIDIPSGLPDIDPTDLGIWIDPIGNNVIYT